MENDSNIIYDIDTDFIDSVTSRCSAIASGVEDATISVPGLVVKYASGVLASAEGIKDASSYLGQFKSILLEAVTGAKECDTEYNFDEIGWDEIKNYIKEDELEDVLANKGPLILAGEDFFECIGYSIGASGNVEIGNYKYNPSTKMLYYGDTSVQVEFYIPTSVMKTDSDGKLLSVDKESLSKKNTVTMLAPSDSFAMSQRDYFNEYKGNAIIISPYKDGTNSKLSYVDLKMDEKVDESTKFANAFSEQKDGCKNYITGCSSGGYSAFNIGASDTYDGTISINSSIQLPGQEHGITEDGLASYAKSGKPVLCIESAADGNDNTKKVQNAMKKIGENYSDINARWTTNRTKNDVDRNSDRFLGYDTWCGIATNYGKGTSSQKGVGITVGEYYGHGAYDGIAYDVVNLGILDGNKYNNGKTFDWDTLTSLEPTEFYKDLELN